MRKIGRFEFPDTPQEVSAWEPYHPYVPLASKVLVVAQLRIEGAWIAYIDAVPGINHNREWPEVLRHGNVLPENLARYLFPEFEHVYYTY